MKRDTALYISGVSKHKYYYQSSPKKRGKKPTSTTCKIGEDGYYPVPDEILVKDIIAIQDDPDTNYGYHKMTFALRFLGYMINHKKVYRLMKEQHLLKDMHKKAAREFVKYRKVMPCGPLEVLEMDIKFVWVEQYKRHALVLTVIDTFTRMVLFKTSAYSIKQGQIKLAWEHIIENYLQPYDCLSKGIHVEIRNDNDSRFLAGSVQQFFKENKLYQVFTHPYTPQENGHIESFHAILSKTLNRYHFWSMDELDRCLESFYEKYNFHRLHSSIAYLTPDLFWKCWNDGLIDIKFNSIKKSMKFKLKIPYHQ